MNNDLKKDFEEIKDLTGFGDGVKQQLTKIYLYDIFLGIDKKYNDNFFHKELLFKAILKNNDFDSPDYSSVDAEFFGKKNIEINKLFGKSHSEKE